MLNLWRTIESVPALSAVGSEWERLMGKDFVAFGSYLQNTGKRAESFPCPRECGCAHRVVVHSEKEMVAVCDCEPCNCDDIALVADALAVWKLNETKLGRAVARAFGCDAKEMDFGIHRTKQIGSFGATSVPVVFTVQHDQKNFSSVVGQLVARIQGPFILLSPSRQFFDGNSQGLLRNVKAGFFDLETNLVLAGSGVLQARQSGGELFSEFLPEQREALQDSVAEKVIAMVSKLRSERGKQKAPLLDVFNYLVLDGISKIQAATQCGCTPGLISLRVKELESRFGMPVEQLQAFQSVVRERSSSVKGDEFRTRKQGARIEADERPEDEESEDQED
jgi:hypothetical protein